MKIEEGIKFHMKNILNQYINNSYAVISDESGKFNNFSILEKAEICLFVKEFELSNLLLSRIINLSSQLNQNQQMN